MSQPGNAFSLVGQGTAAQEGLASFLSGLVYGTTSVLVGHPLDTVKTKMQADPNFRNLNTVQTILKIKNSTGVTGYYAGALPPLMGSAIFRSIQFASYGATFAYFRDENHFLRRNKLFGIEGRVFVGGFISGASRALIESPLDLLKIRQQTSPVSLSSIPISDLYRGFTATLSRNIVLMTTFFAIIDKLANLDPFLRGGIATTSAWTLVWPLDVAKSHMQASKQIYPLSTTLREIIHEGTLFRGYAAGILRSFLANGVSLRAYQTSQKFIADYIVIR